MRSQELTSLSQNEHNEEVAKDGAVWITVPSYTVSLGRRQQHNVLREVPGPRSFAVRHVTLGNFTTTWRLLMNENNLHIIHQRTEAALNCFQLLGNLQGNYRYKNQAS
ncbi:hypothetical protein AVEN_195564-1 [Araneus ventricosus]|uniref:Uncharacterized protein n=1 Tax=Araneus ventricosus TaxID=182803 RepID=A0A4Y2EXH0_ARAVE|nr:hypothetical protein AVEN_195564-1 [Araneus ventricosus]